MVSLRSLAAIVTLPTRASRLTEIGWGVSKLGIALPFLGFGGLGVLACPAGVVLPAPQVARLASDKRIHPLQRGGGDSHEPGVDRESLVGGGLLDSHLQVVGQPQVDP